MSFNSISKFLICGLFISFMIVGCQEEPFEAQKIIENEDIIITQVAPHSYIHTTYLQTEEYGKVACNGMVAINENRAIIFDTPTTDSVSAMLSSWIENEMESEIVAVVPTHYHVDCLGGIQHFHSKKTNILAAQKTIELADSTLAPLLSSFPDGSDLYIGNEAITCWHPGEGHTVDNIVAYFPKDKVLFGGCLIKSVGAGKGYIGEANVEEWSNTVASIKDSEYDIQTVIPGHGNYGNTALLDFTIELFKTTSNE